MSSSHPSGEPAEITPAHRRRPPFPGYLLITAGVGIASGILGGEVWSRIANPPTALVTSTGVVLGETQLAQQVDVTLWFLVTGAALGVLVGMALCWNRSAYGALVVAATVIASVVACWVSYWSGVHLFGPSLPEHLLGSSVRQPVDVALSVGTRAAYLGWPVGALIGAVAAIAAWPARRRSTPNSRKISGAEAAPTASNDYV